MNSSKIENCERKLLKREGLYRTTRDLTLFIVLVLFSGLVALTLFYQGPHDVSEIGTSAFSAIIIFCLVTNCAHLRLLHIQGIRYHLDKETANNVMPSDGANSFV